MQIHLKEPIPGLYTLRNLSLVLHTLGSPIPELILSYLYAQGNLSLGSDTTNCRTPTRKPLPAPEPGRGRGGRSENFNLSFESFTEKRGSENFFPKL